jgi:rubrerythrin
LLSIWGYQELQHHYAFRTWLEALGVEVDAAAVEATRATYPPGTTPAATLATNIISELTVCHVYSGLAEDVDEPILRQILNAASRDEARHAREFRHFAEQRLERHPKTCFGFSRRSTCTRRIPIGGSSIR